MLHRDILKLLMPLELGVVADQDLSVEGLTLDNATSSAAALLSEIFADQAASLISDWERVCALLPSVADTLQARRSRVVSKLAETGSLTRVYFTALAASMGYTVTITEPFATDGPHVWKMTFSGTPVYEFYADESCAEELLLDWPVQTAVEALFQELKPAHSRLIFGYV